MAADVAPESGFGVGVVVDAAAVEAASGDDDAAAAVFAVAVDSAAYSEHCWHSHCHNPKLDCYNLVAEYICCFAQR